MRPDCSLLIRPRSGAPYETEALDIWLHFDAKYKVDDFTRQFGSRGSDAAGGGGRGARRSGAASSRDLLKMHAYRDAIQNSAGAFVLFPVANSPTSE